MDTENAVAASLAVQGLAVKEINGHPFVVTAEGQSVESLEHLLPAPLRRKSHQQFNEVQSFVDYVDRFRTSNALLIAEPDNHRVGATLDYHAAGADGAAAWKDHTALLTLRLAPEWTAWNSRNNHHFGQVDFAEFIEQNLPDIAEPDGAQLKEAVEKMQVNRNVRVASAVNLDSGEIAFTYEDQDNKSKGSAKLPRRLVLGLPVYKHGTRYRVDAAMRYRLNDGKLSFFYVLQRPDKVAEAAFEGVVTEIAAGLDMRPLIGVVLR